MIKVLVADDGGLVRSGFKVLLDLEDDIKVVGEARNGAEAVELARATRPDVILMDIALRGNMNGIEATKLIRGENPAIQVLAVTAHDSPEYFFELMKAEAVGYVLKEATPSELFTAIRAAHRGEAYFYPSIARYLLNDYLRRVRSGHEDRVHYDGLTDREREVAIAIGQGKSNAEIAAELFMSVATVKAHVSRLLQKLDLDNRVQIALLAHDAGVA